MVLHYSTVRVALLAFHVGIVSAANKEGKMIKGEALVEIKSGNWLTGLLASWKLLSLDVTVARCVGDLRDESNYAITSHIPTRYLIRDGGIQEEK